MHQSRSPRRRTAPVLEALQRRTLLSAALQWSPTNEPGSGGWIVSLSVSPHDSSRVLVGGDMLGVGLSTDRGNSWQATTGFKSWEMGSFTWSPTDPNTVWVGSLSGPYKSTDAGQTWAPKRSGLPGVNGGIFTAPIEQVVYDPNADRLLAFGGNRRNFYSNTSGTSWNAVWQSTDGGDTWTRRGTVGTAVAAGVRAAAYVGDDTLLAVVSGQGVFRSVDDGLNWTAVNTGVPTGLKAVNLVADARRNGTAYIGVDRNGSTPGGLWKTTDSGNNWVAINTGLTRTNQGDSSLTSNYPGLAIGGTASPTTLYSSDNGWYSDGIFRSTNGGSNWLAVMDNGGASVPQGFYGAGPSAFVIAVDPNDANAAFAGTSDRVWRTLDGGATWTDVMATKQANGTWKGTGFSGLVTVNVKFNPYADQSAMMSMDDGKLILSSDGLQTFTRPGSSINRYSGGNDITFAGPNGSTMYVTFGQFGGYDGIARSTDGGTNWSYVTKPAGSSGQPTGIYARFDQAASVWAVVGAKLYASTNSGSSWTAVTGAITGASLKWISGDPSNAAKFYITSNQGLWQTTDGGASFTLVSGTPTSLDRVVLDPTNPSRLYVTSWRTGGSTSGLWRLQGGTWTRLRNDPFIQNVAVDPTNANRLIATTNDHPYHDETSATGVWLSVDGGVTWRQENDGLGMTRGEAIAFDPRRPGRVLLGTYGRGFFTGQLDVTPPSITGTFDYDAPRQRVLLNFSEPLGRSLTPADVSLVNTTTGQTFAPSQLELVQLSSTQLQVRWTGASSLSAVLADGNYQLSLAAGSATDGVGNAITAQWNYDFSFLNTDFDRSGSVDFGDLLLLAQRYGQQGTRFSSGDADYNGTTNFSDLLMLAQRYGTSLSTVSSRASGETVGATGNRTTPARRRSNASQIGLI